MLIKVRTVRTFVQKISRIHSNQELSEPETDGDAAGCRVGAYVDGYFVHLGPSKLLPHMHPRCSKAQAAHALNA